MNNKRGFTLIELLVVISVISILAIVVLVGLKPAQRLADTRDARRAEDINQILTGIMSCAIDKRDNANLTTCLGSHTTGKTYEIVSGVITTGCNNVCVGVSGASDCLQLNTTLSDYFLNMPIDPNNSVAGHTGYSVTAYTNGMVVIDACASENGPIKVSR
jgi:prepilin-type N-terminal cleavage/methylation domain-containing protein